ncbi:MAG: hypothetical protein ACI9YE_001764 [Psychroserpens sp.]|jgi:hypothetical protein
MNLQEQIDFLKNQLEKTAEWLSVLVVKQGQEFTKPKSKRFLVDGVNCFFLSPCGSLFDDEDSSSLAENDNAFIDKESAQLQAQRNTLVYRMRVAALESPVDWSNEEAKYLPIWDYEDGDTNVSSRHYSRSSQLPHFACDAELRKFIRLLSKDEQKLLICGVE